MRRDQAPKLTLGHEAWPRAAKTAILAGFSGSCQLRLLLRTGALGHLGDLPGLGARDRAALLDHHLVAHLGVVASSCAWYFLVRLTTLPMVGCMTWRSTRTVTVLSILSLTTRPVSWRALAAGAFAVSFIWRSPSSG